MFAGLFVAVAWLEGRNAIGLTGPAIVHDGDTLTVAGERVRLKGIDAPELGQSCLVAGRQISCGRQSAEALREMLRGRQVSCSGSGRDRYGRVLARCEIDGNDVGLALVTNGHAVSWHDYASAERKARDAGRGIWAGEFVTPGEWRAMRGGLAEFEWNWFGRLRLALLRVMGREPAYLQTEDDHEAL